MWYWNQVWMEFFKMDGKNVSNSGPCWSQNIALVLILFNQAVLCVSIIYKMTDKVISSPWYPWIKHFYVKCASQTFFSSLCICTTVSFLALGRTPQALSEKPPEATHRWQSDRRRRYLGIHEQMSHQSHGLLQRVPLRRDEGLVLVRQATGSGHHEVGDLVVEVVERLHRCGRSTGQACQLRKKESLHGSMSCSFAGMSAKGPRVQSSPFSFCPSVCSGALLLQSCLICFIRSHCSQLQNNPSSGQEGNH